MATCGTHARADAHHGRRVGGEVDQDVIGGGAVQPCVATASNTLGVGSDVVISLARATSPTSAARVRPPRAVA
jgi:hypothetical protein